MRAPARHWERRRGGEQRAPAGQQAIRHRPAQHVEVCVRHRSPTWGRCRPRGRRPLSPSQQASAPASPAVRCPSSAPTPAPPADAGDAGSGLPRHGSRHRRRPGRDTTRSWRPPRSSRAPARRMHSPSRPGRGRGGAVPWSGTSPRYGLGSPGHAARHRPRQSDRTSPQSALPPSPSGWRRTAQPATHLCGRRPAGAGTPFYAQTSVRGSRPLLSRRTSPNVPSDNSIAAPVGRLPQDSESYSRRVGQAKNSGMFRIDITCVHALARKRGPSTGSPLSRG